MGGTSIVSHSDPAAFQIEKTKVDFEMQEAQAKCKQLAQSLIWVALVIINALGISGHLGGVPLLASNLGLVGLDALLTYANYSDDKLSTRKWTHIVLNLVLAGVFNGLGLAGVGPFSNSLYVAIAQLGITVVISGITRLALQRAWAERQKELRADLDGAAEPTGPSREEMRKQSVAHAERLAAQFASELGADPTGASLTRAETDPTGAMLGRDPRYSGGAHAHAY